MEISVAGPHRGDGPAVTPGDPAALIGHAGPVTLERPSGMAARDSAFPGGGQLGKKERS